MNGAQALKLAERIVKKNWDDINFIIPNNTFTGPVANGAALNKHLQEMGEFFKEMGGLISELYNR